MCCMLLDAATRGEVPELEKRPFVSAARACTFLPYPKQRYLEAPVIRYVPEELQPVAKRQKLMLGSCLIL